MSATPTRFAPPRQAIALRRGSSLARGLVYDISPAMGAKEQAYRRDMTVTGSLVASVQGMARAQTGTARAFVIPDAPEQRSAAVTMWARVRRTGTVGDYTTIIGKNWQGNASPTFISYDLSINPGDAAGQNNIRASKGYSGSIRAVTATHGDTTQWFDAALVIDSTGLYLYLDGVLAASNVVDDPTSAIAYGASGNNDWMTNIGSSTAPLDYARILQWNRGLTASEIAELSNKTQPLSGFERSRTTRLDTSAGGGGDLTDPTWPGGTTLGFVTKTDTTIALMTSAAATDDIAVTGYEWSSDNGATYPFTSLSNSFTFTALTALTSYNFRVRAYDAAGNRSTALTLTTSTYRAGDTGQNIVDDTVAIPGVQEEGFLYNDVVLPGDAAKWFSYNITTPVVDTANLTLYPNGSFIWTGLSADSFYYQLEVDGANVGSPQLVTLDPADGSQDLTFTLFTNTNSFPAFTVANESPIGLTFTTFTNTQTFYPFSVYRAGDPLPSTGGDNKKLSMRMGMGL